MIEVIDEAVEFVLGKIDRRVGTRAESVQAPVTFEIPRPVMRRLLALEPDTPDGPCHNLLRETLQQADYRALLAEMEGEGSFRVSEPSAVYDVTKMTQRRLFE